MDTTRAVVSIRLPNDLLTEIDEERVAQRIQVNRTQFIERAVREFIERLREERQQRNGASHVRQL